VTEPLKFLADVPAMTGGKDAILKRAREMIANGAIQLRANATRKEYQKVTVLVIVDAIKDNLRVPLEKRIEDHIRQIEDDYYLFEGEPPAEPGLEADVWNEGLNKRILESFAGDLTQVLGADKLRTWVASDAPSSGLVEDLLAVAVEDVGNAFSRLGIGPDDIDSLLPLEPSSESPQPAERKRGRQPRLNGPTPLTEAAQRALIVLRDDSRFKDVDVANALVVSRASVIGYRDGKTLFSPSEAQIAALNKLFDRAIKPLTEALDALLSASLE
jgi:hypothetical protein